MLKTLFTPIIIAIAALSFEPLVIDNTPVVEDDSIIATCTRDHSVENPVWECDF